METKTYPARNRAGWPAGPWDDEPDKKQWPDPATGLPCLAVRGPLGAWCGYVGLPPDHPLHGKDYSDVDVDVHGGLTFADMCRPEEDEGRGICHIAGPGEPEHVWWLGFDCAHCDDLIPRMSENEWHRPFPDATYRNLAYVEEQCTCLAAQLAAMRTEGYATPE